MQNKNGAVELIRKYQRLFTDLNHRQIAERLVRLVVTKPSFSRVVLVIERDRQLYVEAVGSYRNPQNIVALDTEIEKVSRLPVDLIRHCFATAAPQCLDLSSPHPLKHHEYQLGTKALYLHPIVENGRVVAVFHMESETGPVSLSQAVQELESVWVFSALLVRQIIELWRNEEQGEKFRLAEQALWASETYLNAILFHSPALISVKDLDGNVVLASEHYKQLLNVGEEGYVGKTVHDVYPPEVAEILWENDSAVLEEASQGTESEFTVQHKDGTYHTYLMLKFPLRDRQDKVFGVCTICTDITERKAAEDALREQQSRLNYLAFHDALTGLPNRTLFYDRISQGLARAQRNDSKLVLMLLDLDRFKNINDSLGHDAGDLLLKAVSQRLHEGIRDMDTVARLGGDEFVVVLEGIHDRDDVTFIANKLLATLARPVSIHGHEITTTVSIGISVYPQDGDNTDELLKHADIAMYKAKEAGKNNYQFYTRGMNATAVNYLLLENDLRRAIEQDQLSMYYQPQIDLQTGSLMGVEALVRWQHPERGLIGPINFISLAEETGLIVPLGEWVLRAACQQQKTWLQAGKYVGKVAVNLSARQFRQQRFAERIADILTETELPAKYLELEITESSAMEHAGETINMLNLLNQMGLSLAIDDFGTGYSSLAYLKRFPIQKLKIDRSFISDIYTDQNDASIARSIIGLAHNMMLNVVAEGVEDTNQAEWLRRQGCDQAQGFLYAQPMPAGRLESFFKGGTFSINNNVVKLELPA
ncbi:EAL domain-containing protein [Exilibacterium tricleocarpae]|uniref:cyclic-guanylate-specific phosphodiesterase n=1 Tax=Exilibacterium tricleocarpae TaxID=2591008 RepID=A0A545STG8_9GAMM|nr:GGDEF and EAL domain-containing protein [Exilibacterium tricleocarpae]TQV68251.1 EAL domain-containing protein [Exilibacterium tricleocarpae]